MYSGKKSIAERLVYGAMDRIEQQTHRSGLETFETAMRNATPILEVKPKRVGGATYQIPVDIRPDRRQALAVRWLIQAARKRPGKSFEEKLSAELLDASHGLGATIKRKEDMHKMAESNRAFSHYRT
jgi:small subunit ribosomal protein S7